MASRFKLPLPEITFRRPWPARSYGYRVLPDTGQPGGYGDADPEGMPARGGGAASVPPSVAIIDSDPANTARQYMGRTEDSLNTGEVPNRINRGTTARNMGGIGPAHNPVGINGWPYDGNALLVPHIGIPRTPITVTPFQRTMDTEVTVPSIYIGGPV